MRSQLLALFLVGCATPGQVTVTVVQPARDVGVATGLAHTLHMTEGCTAVDVGSGLVLTAKHCVDKLTIGDETSVGILVVVSPDKDFAVLFNESTLTHSKPALRACIPGEHLYAIGWPRQLVTKKSALTITDGICTGASDPADGTLRITAPIYFGNSGGGAWGEDGALLGLTVKGVLAYPGMNYLVSSPDMVAWLP